MSGVIPTIVAPATVIPPPDAPTTTDPKATALPTTTSEEDRHTKGQRFINAIWESTQAIIALAVIGSALYVDSYVAINGITMTEGQSSALMQLNVMGALVTGFYFGRTNHQRVGGVQGGR